VHAGNAQDAPASLTIDVGDCLTLKSPGTRFDCYERHVEAAKAANRPASNAAPQPDVATAAPTPPPSVTPVTDPVPIAAATTSSASASAMGSSTDTAGFPQRSSPPLPPEIVATVTELHETVPNALLITLDNGQVWRQNIPQRFALKPGQRVTLHGTKWGSSFRLSADALNGFIQVERVR